MRSSLLAALFVTSALLTQGLAGCGGSTSSGPGTATDATSKAIGTTGGTISTPSGVTIAFGAGALATTTTVTITESSTSPLPTHATAVGTPYIFGPEGSTFAHAVTLTLPFTATSLPAGKSAKDIAIYTAPVGSMTFTRLATTVVDSTHVTAETLHFSVFVPAISEVDAGAETDASAGGCADDSECARGEVCVANVCSVSGATDAGPAGCADDSECPSGQVCEDNACVVGATVVDASAGGCANDSECPSGEVCQANECVVSQGRDASVGGCSNDSQCASGQVCVANECVASGGGRDASTGGHDSSTGSCRHDSDCASGEVCEARVCVVSGATDASVGHDADADAGRCAAGETPCGTECVDISSDSSNCGACSMACSAGTRCDQGRCAS